MQDLYLSAAAAHAEASRLAPLLPPAVAGPIAGLSGAVAFLLVFYLATSSLTRQKALTFEEVTVTVIASLFTGIGTVALFTAVGVYV